MSKLILGLDLGPNSIGWALIRDDSDDPSQSELVDLGSRVFPEGVDAFDTSKEKSRNEDRRIARAMRRQVRRRVVRRKNLIKALIESGLWPGGSASQEALYGLDPYVLRAKGLTERLEPHEFGRVLLHLNQRRGFLSNRKKDRGDSEVTGMLAEINENEAKREAGGFATIGEYLASKAKKEGDKQAHRNPVEDDHVRNRHLARSQFYHEFDVLWREQAKHHPELLTDALRWGKLGSEEDPKKAVAFRKPISKSDERRKEKGKKLSDLKSFGLHGMIFFQRPMYWPKSVVGLCELEPKQKRCPRADRHAEQIRVLQEINNLKYADTETHEEHPLNEEQRTLLLDHLATREKSTFDQIRKKLGFLESVKFNLERGKRSFLKGMTLDWLLAKATDKKWHDRTEEDKDAIVTLLRDNEREDDLVVAQLIDKYGFSAEHAEALLDVDLPPGYGSLSRMAIDKLLPHLAKGMIYQSQSDPERSALHAAGYLRRDELQRRLFDQLPDLSRTNPRDCKLGDLPNPVVKRALVEIRKVVNAIIKAYGKPDAVHVEMARSLRMGPKARSEYNTRTRQREKERDEAAKAIRNTGVAVRREGIIRFLAWKEQSCECVYCGKAISQEQLFGGGVDVDHILPYSRCLDDSQMNKVVCHRECNHDKGQKTPYEWLADSDPKRYEAIGQRVGSLMRKGAFPYPKYRRFLQKELKLDDFIARQLADTGYITRATVEYLQLLFDKPSDVLGLKGQLTAELRWQWGLSTILSELPDSPAWQEEANVPTGEKNRADHRHHAIDAVVLALTNRKRLRVLSDLVHRGGERKHGEIVFEPWDNFRSDVAKRIAAVNVSHRVERKVRGALHEETLYGPTKNPEEWVVRKAVVDLSAAEVDRVRDPAIKKIIRRALANAGLIAGRGKKPDAKKMKMTLSNLAMPSGVPIKRVRLIKPEKTIAPLREEGAKDQAYVKPGSTHHLCIFEFEVKGKKKRDAVFVTMLEATQRIKRQKQALAKSLNELKGQGLSAKELQKHRKEAMRQAATEHPLIQRDATQLSSEDRKKIPADAEFVMSLSSRELVLANYKSEKLLLQFRTAASTSGQIWFTLATDSRPTKTRKVYSFRAATLDAQKVTTDPLGQIRWAND